MRVRIHRGSREIGGTCIEIESLGKRIVLDVGLPLDAEHQDVPLPEVKGFDRHDPSLLGVFISHSHADHYGLAGKLPAETPILIGAAARRILESAAIFTPGGITFEKTIQLQDQTPLLLGPFRLTPFLVDHSAYDAYALLVEADGRRLFYSGDFRGHGRKASLLDRFVRDPLKNIDVLLMEGTTISRDDADEPYPTETDLEREMLKLFKATSGMVLVWCSGQNIDRLVSIYRACRQAKRLFIADMYTADVLRATHNEKIPQAEWKTVRVFLPSSQRKQIKRQQRFKLAQSYRQQRIYPEDLRSVASQSVMLFRPSMTTDLEKAGCLDDAGLIYSLWAGYLERDSGKDLQKWLADHQIPLIQCHTSGHAHVRDLKRLASALGPRMLVPIHTSQPQRYSECFENVVLWGDGEWWSVDNEGQ